MYGKGGVEGEAGFFRRNQVVPVPSARNLDELNTLLLASCREDEVRTIDGHPHTAGEALAIERDHVLPMPIEGFDLMEVSFARVDGLRRVRVRSNGYSAPVWPGTSVHLKLTAATVEISHKGRCVARHPGLPAQFLRQLQFPPVEPMGLPVIGPATRR